MTIQIDALATRSSQSNLAEPAAPGSPKLRCLACAHRCAIAPGQRGICLVRANDGGTLRVPTGYVAALQADPIEKKPFFHVLPGSKALTFGMLGCNLRCAYCQNWEISQAPRKSAASQASGIDSQRESPALDVEIRPISPTEIVQAARHTGSRLVISSYNEPLITAEWAAEVFGAARAAGLRTGVVSNGYATPEVIEYLRPVLDCFKVDLKSMNDATYRQLGGRLAPVLETIGRLVDLAVWVEVVTLLVPGLNDDDAELRAAARFLASVSPSLPWHITAFHPDYRLRDRPRTSDAALARAAEIGRAAGLRYVYIGNHASPVADGELTRCPGCGAVVIERYAGRPIDCRLVAGRCPSCQEAVPGIWD